MKTKWIIMFIVMALILGGLAFDSQAAKSEQGASYKFADGVGAGKVLGVHHYTLKEGVDPQEFERFVAEEWGPVTRERLPGVQVRLMRGVRGKRVGHYVLVFEMNSLYVRNFYCPTSGDASEAANAIWEDCGDLCDKVWTRFEELAERSEYTDYVALVKK